MTSTLNDLSVWMFLALEKSRLIHRSEWLPVAVEWSDLSLLPRVCCMFCCPGQCDSDFSHRGCVLQLQLLGDGDVFPLLSNIVQELPLDLSVLWSVDLVLGLSSMRTSLGLDDSWRGMWVSYEDREMEHSHGLHFKSFFQHSVYVCVLV